MRPILILGHLESREVFSLAFTSASKLTVWQWKNTNRGPSALQETLKRAGTRGFQIQSCKLRCTVTPTHNIEST